MSISGQRPFTNGIVVDGASNQMQFYGRQANDFPQDWIQEFQVLTNAFTAEYGQAAGGVLNVITRSGANKMNGRAYGFFRDANFDSPPFAGRYDANLNPIFLKTRRRSTSSGMEDSSAARLAKQAVLLRRDGTAAARLRRRCSGSRTTGGSSCPTRLFPRASGRR